MTQVFVWTVGDVIGIVAGIIVAVPALAFFCAEWFRQWRCKHDGGVTENRSCNAFCRKCGKNLGFIGNLTKRGEAEIGA